MLKKLISSVIIGSLALSMVGCSSSKPTKLDSNNTLTQVQDIMKSYKVLEAHLNDGVLVVKTQIDYSGNWDNLFKLNLHAIEDLALETDLSNIKELQYWSVCQTTDGGTKKTFACTMGKEQLQMIQNKQVFATEIDNMTSKMTDLYLDSELLQGLSKDVAGQIVINTTKEQNDTEDEKDTMTKQVEQSVEVKQPKESNKTSEKTTQKVTEPKVPQQNKQEKQTTQQKDSNIDPETGLAKVKQGTHLQEEADKQDREMKEDSVWTKEYCPECGKPFNKCICNGDCDPDIVYPDEDNNNLETPIYDTDIEPDEFK